MEIQRRKNNLKSYLEGYARTEMLTGEWFEGVYKDGERQGFFRLQYS